MHSDLLQDIWLCIVGATLLAFVAQLTRQPLVLGYIAAGILIGPAGFGLVNDRPAIETLAELGLAFLLFIVGLEANVRRLLTVARQAAPITAVQVLGSGALVWALAIALGYRGLGAAYLAAAAAFSSTMISLKQLSDRHELETVHGQITLGVLLLQDLAAIAVLAVQPTLGEGFAAGPIAGAAVRGVALVAGTLVAARYVLPPLFRRFAKDPEVTLLAALSWCFVVSYAAVVLRFSIAMGALVAGVSISAFPYTLDVASKVRGLRTFFVTLFFVSLGMLLTRPTPRLVAAALAISAVVVLSRFLTVLPVMRAQGFTRRVGVLTSINLSQTSEFGLVLALVGIQAGLGHIGGDVVSLVVMVMILTATVSTYLIEHSHRIAALAVGALAAAEGDKESSTALVRGPAAPIVLVGCFRAGSSLVHELRQAAIDFSVVDFSQDVNERLNRLGVPTVYGDISHMDTLEHAGVDRARILIASIPDDFLRGTDNLRLLAMLRRLNPGAKIVMTAESLRTAELLYAAGADYVIAPRVLVARHLLEIIAEVGAGMIDDRRDLERKHLRERVEVVP